MTLCVTIATNLTDGLLINYTRIGSAFNKLSENIYFYILTLLIMAVVFDFLRAILEVGVTSRSREFTNDTYRTTANCSEGYNKREVA